MTQSGGDGEGAENTNLRGPLGQSGLNKASGPVMHTDYDVAAFVNEIDGCCLSIRFCKVYY